MKDAYIELGINSSGTVLVLAPVVHGRQFSPTFIALSDLAAGGWSHSVNMIGQMLIAALGPFHPEVKRFRLRPAPPVTPPFPTRIPPQERQGNLRIGRMRLSLAQQAREASLCFRADEDGRAIGEGSQQPLLELEALGTNEAPSRIGETMMRKLAQMHPDVAGLHIT